MVIPVRLTLARDCRAGMSNLRNAPETTHRRPIELAYNIAFPFERKFKP